MSQYDLAAIECLLQQDSDVTLLHQDDELLAEVQLGELVLKLAVRLFQDWLSVELMSGATDSSERSPIRARQLLLANSKMRLAKFGKTTDGAVVLSIDLPVRTLTNTIITDMVELLKGYARVYLQLEAEAVIETAPEHTGYGVNELWLSKGIERLAWHIRESPFRLNYSHEAGGKLPRNHIFRPYRFCVQDVLFGATVVRHAREHNCLEVDVFLTAEVPQYAPDSGVRWLTAFLLSEAYKCGGSMEIRFTENVEGRQIPGALQRLAADINAPFEAESIRSGRILPQEARQLYVSLVDFSPSLRAKIEELNLQNRLSTERVCYSIYHGVWTLSEMESIILSSPYPDVVLSGEIQPEQRHLYSHILFQARNALLGGFLDRKLMLREHTDRTTGAFNLEDDERNVVIGFEPSIYAKRYHCPDESLVIPWRVDMQEGNVAANESVVVLVRARDAVRIKDHLTRDIDLASERAMLSTGEHYYILLPFDFQDPSVSDQERQALITYARSKGVEILVCPETTFTLDAEVRKRLMSSRILRE